jgi:membrane protease YdiL (CAAX protease family)
VATTATSSAPLETASRHVALLAFAFLGAITAAELITAVVHPVWGVLMHFAVLLALLIQSASSSNQAERALMLSLTIAPMIRIVSLGLPLGSFDEPWQYAIVGVPLTVAGLLLMRTIPLSAWQVGLQLPRRGQWQSTLLVIGSGLALGLVEWLILRPDPLVAHLTVGAIALPALSLLFGAGLVEEFLFRGVMQATAGPALGTWPGILYVSLVFGALHIGHLSALDVLFVTAVAVYFAIMVARTRTLFGVALAHGLTNITLFFIWPLVW